MICEYREKGIGLHSAWTKVRMDWKVYLPPYLKVSLEASFLTFKRRIFVND
jgi:hypothetical protein